MQKKKKYIHHLKRLYIFGIKNKLNQSNALDRIYSEEVLITVAMAYNGKYPGEKFSLAPEAIRYYTTTPSLCNRAEEATNGIVLCASAESLFIRGGKKKITADFCSLVDAHAGKITQKRRKKNTRRRIKYYHHHCILLLP